MLKQKETLSDIQVTEERTNPELRNRESEKDKISIFLSLDPYLFKMNKEELHTFLEITRSPRHTIIVLSANQNSLHIASLIFLTLR